MAQKQEHIAAEDPWMQHMMCGNFEAAWQLCDAALQRRAGVPCWHLPRHEQYIWNGSTLQGKKVLVRCYHGLGDTIQMLRYAPMIKAMAAEVIFWIQPALIPLAKGVAGIDQVLPLHDGTPDVAYDVDVESMELPHIFRTTPATIPDKVPYIHAPYKILPRHSSGLNVGIAWKGGDWDERRNVPFALLQPLFTVPHCRFYILQASAEKEGWQAGFGVHPGELDVSACAAAISCLDLVITIDSMMAHLAGALGIPTWTLLHTDADWRWMRARTDSPWYPSMRLFRQTQQDDWAPVIHEVSIALKTLAAAKMAGRKAVPQQ